MLLEDAGSRILSDPWLLDGAYYGVWCHYPRSSLELSDPLARRRYIEEELDDRTFTNEHLEAKRVKLGFETDTTVLVGFPEDRYADVTMNGAGYDLVSTPAYDDYDGYVQFDRDPRLLNRILRGPEHAHWADAKIGSHFGISKQPDVYERGLYEVMAAFHT